MRTLKISIMITSLLLSAIPAAAEYPQEIQNFIKQSTQQFTCGQSDLLWIKVYLGSKADVFILGYQKKEFKISSGGHDIRRSEYLFIKDKWESTKNVTKEESGKAREFLWNIPNLLEELSALDACLNFNLRSRGLLQ